MEIESHEDDGHSDVQEMEVADGGQPPAEPAEPGSLEKCEFCCKALTKEEVANCKKDHLKKMCDQDRQAYRAMMQQAREQGRTSQLEELRKTDPRAFGLMVLEFREKCCTTNPRRGKAKPKFDFSAFFTQLEKGKRSAVGGYQVMKTFHDYVTHYTGLSYPLKLTNEQATRHWHSEKNNPRHPQDRIRSPDADGLPNGPFVTRLAVTLHDYVDTSKYTDSKAILQAGSRRDKPTEVQVEDMQDAFRKTKVLDDDDPLNDMIDLPAPPSRLNFGQVRASTDGGGGGTRNTKGRAGEGTPQPDTGAPAERSAAKPKAGTKPQKIRNLKVVVEKQKISTNGKMLDMTDRIRPEVQELMQNALALMKEGGHIPQELMSLGPDDLSLDTEELSASPLLCLKLRWVIADMLFGTCTDRDNVPESTMEKIIDADPFLGAHSEFKKANGVKHVDDVKKGREQWTAVKTESEAKSEFELWAIQMRNLGRVHQSLLSVKKDFESEKKELDKAIEAQKKKDAKQQAQKEKREKGKADRAAKQAAEPKGKTKAKAGRITVTDVGDDDFPVIKSIPKFASHRRISVVPVDAEWYPTGEDLRKVIQDLVVQGDPFILRPKKGKSILKLMEAPKEVEDAMVHELTGFISEFANMSQNAANENKPPLRSSTALPETEEIKALLTAMRFETDDQKVWDLMSTAEDEAALQRFGTFNAETLGLCLEKLKVDPPVGMNVEFKSEEMAQDALNGSSSGLAQGGSYVGVEQNFFGSFRLQYAGNRLLALARPSEVMEFIEQKAVPPALDFMKGVTPDSLSPGSVPSFCVNQVSPGDLVWTPCAYLFVEKAVNANSIALRVPTPIFSGDSLEDLLLMKDFFRKKPVIEATAMHLQGMDLQSNLGIGDVAAAMSPPPPNAKKEPVKVKEEAAKDSGGTAAHPHDEFPKASVPDLATTEKPDATMNASDIAEQGPQAPPMEADAPSIAVETQAESPVHGGAQPMNDADMNDAEKGNGQQLGKGEQPPAAKGISQAEMPGAENQHMEELRPPCEIEKSQVAGEKEVDGHQLGQEIEKEIDKVEQFPPPPGHKLLDEQQGPAPETEMEDSKGKGEQPLAVEGVPQVQAEMLPAEEREGQQFDAKPEKVVDKPKVDWHAVEAGERKRFVQMNLKGESGLLNYLNRLSLSSEEMAKLKGMKKADLVEQLVSISMQAKKSKTIKELFPTPGGKRPASVVAESEPNTKKLRGNDVTDGNGAD